MPVALSYIMKRILIVDDEKKFLDVFSDSLRDSDWSFYILTAGNGEEALKVLESESVDLVVTDLKMPVMDGFELLSRIRKNYPDVPVIAMSAFLNPDAERRLRSARTIGYIEKPFSMEKIMPMILSGLERHLGNDSASPLDSWYT